MRRRMGRLGRKGLGLRSTNEKRKQKRKQHGTRGQMSRSSVRTTKVAIVEGCQDGDRGRAGLQNKAKVSGLIAQGLRERVFRGAPPSILRSRRHVLGVSVGDVLPCAVTAVASATSASTTLIAILAASIDAKERLPRITRDDGLAAGVVGVACLFGGGRQRCCC